MEEYDYAKLISLYCSIVKVNSYLELGVEKGFSMEIIAPNVKEITGVDIEDIRQFKTGEFFKMATDKFFKQNKKTFDIIFIDACHYFEQVLLDFENSLKVLNPNGAIFLHDTDPDSWELANRDKPYAKDAYKIIDYIYQNYPELNVMIMPITNAGLTMIRRKKDRRIKEYDDRDYWSVPSASNNLSNPNYKGDVNIYPSHEKLYEEIKKLEFDSILEVGCGFGKNLKKLQEILPSKKIQGCDINPIIIEKAGQFLGKNMVFINSAESIKLPDNSFDVVFTNGVLQHIAPKNIKSVISQISRVAKKYIIHSECCYSEFLDPKAVVYLDISKPVLSFNYNYKELYKEIGLNNFQWLVDNTKGKSEMEAISIMLIKELENGTKS